ncbi:MAG: amidohydrolase family protein [Planctomycetota bacterium]
MTAVRRIIDCHAHAFPDELAERAVPQLAEGAGVEPALDGTVGSLLRSMDAAGIRATVVASIATKPQQFDAIVRWSSSIASERLVPFPSVHPSDPQAVTRVRQLAEAGFRGLKLHPYYQQFELDAERLFPLYEAIADRGLVLLCHTGFDVAYPRERICDPVRVAAVAERFPELKLVTAHIGAWEDWDEVRRHMLGSPIYMECSFSFDWIPPESARELLLAHPKEYLLFGSDSPWGDQARQLEQLRALDLGPEREAAMLWENAERLLGLAPAGL